MKEHESINEIYSRFTLIINGLKLLGKIYPEKEVVRKVLRSLPKRWEAKLTAIQEAKDLNVLKLEELVGSRMIHEITMKIRDEEETTSKKKSLALKAETSHEPVESDDDFDPEMALITRRFKKFLASKRDGKIRRNPTNQSHQRNNSDWNNKTASSNSRDFKEKKFKSRKALLTWDDSDETDKETNEDDDVAQLCFMAKDDHSDKLWHRRLGHVHMDLIKKLLSKELVRGLPKLKFVEDKLQNENELKLVKIRSDHGGCLVDRKSTSGTCQFLGNALVSWHSKKQTYVALSTAEAEYVAAGSCCAQVLWMRQTLLDFGVSIDHIPIMCDSSSAIDISKNPVQHSRTKHIDIRHHFLRDNVQKGLIELKKNSQARELAQLLVKKGNASLSDQFRDFKKTCDQLNAIGKPATDQNKSQPKCNVANPEGHSPICQICNKKGHKALKC
ncbi:hypothetical protein RJ640_016346 [Escallonia rubra]|uniref:GAG-pre-integrase domain-containing protein n=1 Tax=Escallonia rubra TaxID=112253 RepID=A0AA88UMQ0_9ASTE|nr:hypothetical protein RJ640_016346 [Escallonia rubra]